MGKRYALQDVKEPQLYEEMFRYDMIPKITFDNEFAKAIPAEDYWITCTTFRDGQQARPPIRLSRSSSCINLCINWAALKELSGSANFSSTAIKTKKRLRNA